MCVKQSSTTTDTQVCHIINESDLPLACPMPNKEQWDSHPRIYLPISKTNYASCPYCGAVYQLVKEQSG